MLLALLAIGYLWLLKPPLLNNINFSQAVYSEQQLLFLSLANDDKYRLYVPLTDISPFLIKATLLQEDRYFDRHFGFNPWALVRAGWQTYIA
jgi:penicillin-binding protein 1C